MAQRRQLENPQWGGGGVTGAGVTTVGATTAGDTNIGAGGTTGAGSAAGLVAAGMPMALDPVTGTAMGAATGVGAGVLELDAAAATSGAFSLLAAVSMAVTMAFAWVCVRLKAPRRYTRAGENVSP